MARRIRQVLKGLLAALVLAVFGTISHQGQIAGFPFGLTLALVAVLLFALELRKQKLAAWTMAIALGLSLFWIGQSFHLDAMIPANLFGFIWGYGAIAISALVAMWPKFKGK